MFLTSDETSLSFVWDENFVRHLDGDDRRQAFMRIFTRQLHLFLFGDATFLRIGIDHPGHGCAESGQMGAAIALGNVVGKTQGRFVIAVCPFKRQLDTNTSFDLAVMVLCIA